MAFTARGSNGPTAPVRSRRAAAPRRVFIVGFSRSGTTLLQSVLGSHPDVFTLPETHFFTRTIVPPKARFLGRVHPSARRVLPYLADAGLPYQVPTTFGLTSTSTRRWTRAFLAALDRQAIAAGASVWVEKTPIHLHYLDVITRFAPDAQVVHIVREPVGAVRSFVAARSRNHATWHSLPDDDHLTHATERWVGDLHRTEHWVRRPGHHVVRYEQLTADPAAVLGRLFTALGLSSDPATVEAALAARIETGRAISLPYERWKARVTDQVDGLTTSSPELSDEALAHVEAATRSAWPVLERLPYV